MPTPVRRIVQVLGALVIALLVAGSLVVILRPSVTSRPPPQPVPTLKVPSEEPVIDASGNGAKPGAAASSDLPVLRAPAVLAPPRFAVPSSGSAEVTGRPSLRQGYQQYLRAARPAQVAAIAVPGLIGLVALTASGIVTGYRQANAGRRLRTDAARFLA